MTTLLKQRLRIATPLEQASLFLDLDGTLAAFEPHPGAVQAVKERTMLLGLARSRLGGRLAVLSGRTISEVDRILDRSVACVAGMHGLDCRRHDGARVAVPPHPALSEVNSAFEAVARARAGLLVEQKPLSVALHYRNAPEAAEAVHELAERLAQQHGLDLQRGAMVAELKTPGPDKGDALRAFMAERPFAGTLPIFVGDDLTDEPGFQAAASLGGFGVLVGKPRPTSATARLENPEATLAWLEQSIVCGAFTLEVEE